MPERDPELDELFSLTYEELRRLAVSVKKGAPGATVNPTALVHEAYLKLARSAQLRSQSLLHFRRIAARAMRQVLVEMARRRQADKRGGAIAIVTFDEAPDVPVQTADDLLALDCALDRLSRMNPRQAAMVEYRFYGGFSVSETAQLLDISESTLLRDWRAAGAWLARELRDSA
ncbi:MAG: ECF-type sigma factor [Longimicrobiales bacterium]